MPSVGKVNVAVIEVALVNETEVATVIAPVDELIASTTGILTKLVPAITTAVASLGITEGVKLAIVGRSSV